jgi:hypothetical protein
MLYGDGTLNGYVCCNFKQPEIDTEYGGYFSFLMLKPLLLTRQNLTLNTVECNYSVYSVI